MASGGRQLPGLSCEECRRRKARCDRIRPQCGTCTEMAIECIVNENRPQRGPKKGQLKVLRSRVATLERQLSERLNTIEFHTVEVDPKPMAIDKALLGSIVLNDVERDMSMNMDFSMSDMVETSKCHPAPLSRTPNQVLPNPDWQGSETEVPEDLAMGRHPDMNTISVIKGLDISNVIWADLDLLYFDRVHSVLPIIHRRRYLAWAGQEVLTPARRSLRLAIRAIAAAVSTQFPGLGNILYTETRRILEAPDMDDQGPSWMVGDTPLKKVQAWLLVAHYELMCMHEQQAMLTAGRAFRLVQLSGIYDVDRTDTSLADDTKAAASTSPMPDESFAEAEEKRRTFWLAFSFDRFLNIRNEWLLTLYEEMICARLPAPETHFQNNVPIQMAFLPDILNNVDQITHSTFAECVVLATIYGRCMTHRRLSFSANEPRIVWTGHKWLASMLERRAQLLLHQSTNTSVLDADDPMLAFSYMLARSAIIYHSNTTEMKPWRDVKDRTTANTYEAKAYQAGTEIADLAKTMPKHCCFKAHPFLPSALSDAAAFLVAHPETPSDDDSVEQLLSALRNLQNVNNLARDLLIKLEVRSMHIAAGVASLNNSGDY
ncbi:fungal-specific transcription factor domain-containing protein [Annulohypoxylon nitens]|nr:fungal-specific transcription factor domain-containing protein [Annulohypoxylon nitens]